MTSDDEIMVLFDSRQPHDSRLKPKVSYSFNLKPSEKRDGLNASVKNTSTQAEGSFLAANSTQLRHRFFNGYIPPEKVYKENIVHQMFSSVEDKQVCKIEIIPTSNPKVHVVLSTKHEQKENFQPMVAQDMYQPVLLKRIKVSTNKKSDPNFNENQNEILSLEQKPSMGYLVNSIAKADSDSSFVDASPEPSVSNIFQNLNAISKMRCNKLYPIITVNTTISSDELQRKNFGQNSIAGIFESSSFEGRWIDLFLSSGALVAMFAMGVGEHNWL